MYMWLKHQNVAIAVDIYINCEEKHSSLMCGFKKAVL